MKQVDITITIKGNRARIEGEFPKTRVRRATSFPIPGIHFRRGRFSPDGRHHFLTRTQSLPPGLVHLVDEELRRWAFEKPERTYTCTLIDQRKAPATKNDDFKLKGIDLRDYQEAAVMAMIEGQRGILKAATNAGKTFIFAALCKYLCIPTLLVVPGKELLYQAKDDLEKALNWPIGIIGDGKWKQEMITVSTSQTLSRRLNSKDKAKKKEAADFLKSIDMICVDECHTAGAKSMYTILNKCPAFYRFGMSGTPLDRTDGADLRLIAQTGPVLYEVTNAELVAKGYSLEADIEIITIEQPVLPNNCDYETVYQQGIVENAVRNEAILGTALHYVEQGRQCVIMVRRIEHGDILLEMLEEATQARIEYVTGEDATDFRQDMLQDFKAGKIPILITTNILRQGVSINTIDVIINAAAGKSRIDTLQKLGRGLRTGGNADRLVMVEFADLTHPFLSKHSLVRLKDYKKENCFRIKRSAVA